MSGRPRDSREDESPRLTLAPVADRRGEGFWEDWLKATRPHEVGRDRPARSKVGSGAHEVAELRRRTK